MGISGLARLSSLHSAPRTDISRGALKKFINLHRLYFLMLKQLNALGNIEVDEKQGYILLSLNPSLYPLDAVLSASERFIDKACIILDGDPSEEILVEIRPKQEGRRKADLNKLAFDFNRQLIIALRQKIKDEKKAKKK
jgi:hypothetical protein